MIFFPLREGAYLGPFGAADAYIFIQSQIQIATLTKKAFFVIDLDTDVYIEHSMALMVLYEEIMKITTANEQKFGFYRQGEENLYTGTQ